MATVAKLWGFPASNNPVQEINCHAAAEFVINTMDS